MNTVKKYQDVQRVLGYRTFKAVHIHSNIWIDIAQALWGFPGGSEVKASACNVGDLGLIPGSGRSPGDRNGNPLQCSCLENPMDGEAW